MNRDRRQGFTLIELLTVIAIISILAGLTFTVLPRVRERAKVTKIKGTMGQLNTSLLDYFADNNTFPPAYGYRKQESRDIAAPTPGQEGEYYHLEPYTVAVKINGVEDMYDNFSVSYDTDGDRKLSLLEFLPLGTPNPATGGVVFDQTERYNGANLAGEVTAQLGKGPRPIVYVPVNSRQAALSRKYWVESGDWLATNWEPDNDTLRNISFPPQSYDAFVLLSGGPEENTGGILQDLGTPPMDDVDIYHIAGLRAYFLATRDLNGNNLLDFEFEARTQNGEGKAVYTVPGHAEEVSNTLLPNGTPLGGPIIFVSN